MKRNLKLIYFSPTEGTKKIVRAIGDAITKNYEEFNITLPQNRTETLNFTEDDLLIIGVPTYAGRFPKVLNEYVEKINCNNSLAIFVTTYGNRDYEDSLLELKDIFVDKGATSLAAATFIAEHSYTDKLAKSRPNLNDLDIAHKFGTSIKNRLDEIASIDELNSLSLPGNYPYIVKTSPLSSIAPVTNEACTNCGICANNCPTAAIDFENLSVIDSSKCLKCCSCIKKCPVNAKDFIDEGYLNFKAMLISKFENNICEPEIFIG
ncbi:EFR1 family ferrodoxin [Clostridium sp.]|uniref:EFR1 family ferrodoxin n=1 Tax=Clostridium sp. TaxID=1506 RepID=UPI00261EB337|nr:EFR1 family ferrodoxin [Clostridium sp.]